MIDSVAVLLPQSSPLFGLWPLVSLSHYIFSFRSYSSRLFRYCQCQILAREWVEWTCAAHSSGNRSR